MDAAMEMANRKGCKFFEVVGTNKYVTKICTRREFTLVKSIKYEGNDDLLLVIISDSFHSECSPIDGAITFKLLVRG